MLFLKLLTIVQIDGIKSQFYMTFMTLESSIHYKIKHLLSNDETNHTSEHRKIHFKIGFVNRCFYYSMREGCLVWVSGSMRKPRALNGYHRQGRPTPRHKHTTPAIIHTQYCYDRHHLSFLSEPDDNRFNHKIQSSTKCHLYELLIFDEFYAIS